MVESLKELNARCQKSRYKEEGNWMVRHITRDLALPVTWLLLHTRITANQVTLISILTGLLGIGLLGVLSTPGFFAAVLMLQLWYLLDHVDGQIARYYGTSSLSGRFFDFMMHHLIHGLLYSGLALYAFRFTGNAVFLVWGTLLCVSQMMFNVINDAKTKTFCEALIKGIRPQPEPKPVSEAPSAETGTVRGFQLRKIFSVLHKVSEIHVVVNILTGAWLLELILPGWQFRLFLFVFYGVTVPALFAVKTAYVIQKRKIDSEFDAQFKEFIR